MRACPECQLLVEEGARFCPFCGVARAAGEPADPMVGATVSGRFEVEEMIGQGGMGRVYRARHLTLGRPVVLKMLHRAYSDDPQIVARFQREARAASRLDHPNSIAVLEFGAAEDGTLYLAMEYLAGRDLARVVAEEFPLGEARIIRIGAQTLSALEEAHARGIIHRDLKPENVMVVPRPDEPDFVKVLDFGIAKITATAEHEPRLTQTGLVCGTPEYMSPEQARGADLDARSDLYSVGVLLYRLATGELPFEADTAVGFLTKHLVETPVSPRQRRPEISARLDALILRALEKDPARRFEDAAAMRRALLACAEPALAGGAPSPPRGTPRAEVAQAPPVVAAGPQTPPARAVPGVPTGGGAPPAPARPRVPAAAGVAAALVVAIGAGVAVGGRREAPAPDAPATRPPVPAAAASAVPAGTPPAAPAPTPAAEGSEEAIDRARALVRMGDAARGRADCDAAIVAYLAAEAADPALAEVQKKLGLCLQQQGKAQEAAARYRRYLATNPEDAAEVRAVLAAMP